MPFFVFLGSDSSFKLLQDAVADPAAEGTSITFIDTISQDTNGDIAATKKTVRSASTSQTGVVKLSNATNSTSATLAATPKAVKAAYDLANHAHPYLPMAGGDISGSVNVSGQIGIGGTGDSTPVHLEYDSSLEALNFVFT